MPEKKKKTNRAPAGSGCVTQRKDGTWQGSYPNGINPATGKIKREYVYDADQKECVKKLRKLSAEIEAGTFQKPQSMTVGQWFDMWIADYLGAVKPGTAQLYSVTTKRYITPGVGSVQLQKLSTHHIQQFYNSLQRSKGLSPKTIKNVHGILHKALKQAVALGLIKLNPADNAALPRIERVEMQTLQETSLPAFLAAISEHEFSGIYFTTIFTGLRLGEVCGLTWDCVDFDRGVLVIKQQLQPVNGTFSLVPTKNDKPRTIAAPTEVIDKLKAEKKSQAEKKRLVGMEWSNPTNLVFTTHFGRYVRPQTVYDNFKRIVAKLGCPDLRFHDLRHTYAVNALQAGDDIKTVQGNLGHHTAAFTLEVYGHVTEKMKHDSAERMSAFIKSMTTTESKDAPTGDKINL